MYSTERSQTQRAANNEHKRNRYRAKIHAQKETNQREGLMKRERERQRERVCVCVCV